MNSRKNIFAFILASLIVISLLIPLPVKAASSYYISTSGNDSNPGTQSQPWQTIQKCLNTVKAGDTCLIGAGTYNESLNIKTSGASGAPITIRNYNGATVTVNSGSSMTLQTTGKQSYYTIDGLRLISSASGGEGKYTIDLTSVGLANGWPYNETATVAGNSNIILENCYVEGAIIMYGTNNTIQNCEFNGRNVLNDGIRSYLAASTNTLIKNNTIHDYLGRAVWINVIADNAHIVGNTVYNTFLGIDCDGASKPVTNCHVLQNTVYKTGQGSSHTGWGCSIFLEDAFNAVVDRNLLYNSAGADGIYIINYGVGGGNPTWNTDGNIEYRTQDLNAVVSNNVIYGNGDASVLTTSASGVMFYNNTVSGKMYLNSETGVSFYPQHWTVKNNIFTGTSGAAWSAANSSSITSSVFTNNLYWKVTSNSGEAALSADPKFVSSTDFHLQSGSAAIDSGFNLGSVVPTDFDGIVRSQGAGYDIGAFEFKSGQQPAATQSPISTKTATSTPVPTLTPVPSSTPTPPPIPSVTPSRTATLAASQTPSNIPTWTATPSVTPGRTATLAASQTPTYTPTRTAVSTFTPTNTPINTVVKTPTPSSPPQGSATPTGKTLTVKSGTHGKILSPVTSPVILNFGTVQTISAKGNPGYLFVKWIGDVATVANIYSATTTVIMKGNYTITANFVLGSYSIWIPLIRH